MNEFIKLRKQRFNEIDIPQKQTIQLFISFRFFLSGENFSQIPSRQTKYHFRSYNTLICSLYRTLYLIFTID